MTTETIGPSGPTIFSVEQDIETLLERLSQYSSDASPEQAKNLLLELKRYLAPSHLVPVVQLEEDGRKKRSTASASNWNFETGDIVIFYEPPTGARQVPVAVPSPQSEVNPERTANAHSEDQMRFSEEVRQCCDALADAEKSNQQFIGFRRFRDLILAAYPYEWASTFEGRKRVLQEAVTAGAIITKQVPNPNAPSYPTTAILLNREAMPAKSASRFNPVPIKGEPLSATILRDRGDY